MEGGTRTGNWQDGTLDMNHFDKPRALFRLGGTCLATRQWRSGSGLGERPGIVAAEILVVADPTAGCHGTANHLHEFAIFRS
jgi:hypothetical protein